MSVPPETQGAGPSTSITSEENSHLSYYSREKSESPPPASAPAPARELSKNRLYVGNLHPSVDEYTFLQIFNKFGKVSKLDFLFHKSGPSKGKPRGYAFVEFKNKEDALRALINAHDKLLRGRKLVVTYANQAPTYEASSSGPGKHRRMEMQRPTTLSLIKMSAHPGKTEDKIAALEAKLRQMEKQNSAPSSTLPSHPSLPLKPPPETIQMNAALEPTKSNSPHSANQPTRALAKGKGIFASGSGASLGKKPTLEELIKSKKKTAMQGGLLKR